MKTHHQTNLGKVLPAILSALGLALATNAPAASATWTGLGADSLWTTTGNWSTSPVPGVGDTATFNGAGNSKTAITTAPASLYSYLFDTASCAAYTISASSTTWAVTDGGGISINSSVTTAQDLSGIQFIRLTNGTVNFINQGAGLLKIGTCFNANSGATINNMRLNFVPAAGSTIEIVSGKTIDNASTATRSTSILVNDAGTVKMSGTGGYSGPDADGNALTIRQGTFSFGTIAVSGKTALGSIGSQGRLQFGEAGQTRTATLQMTGTGNSSDGQAIIVIDNNTARFDISDPSGNLTIATNITQSAATLGGGNLTKIGAGTLTLTGTNLHTGDTLVSAGTLVVSNNFALTNSAFDTSGAGTLSLPASMTTPTFGGLKGASALTLPATVTSLTLNPASGKSPNYAGTLDGGPSHAMSLTKIGAGTQTLSGNNAFTGDVTLIAGTLKLAHSSALGTGTKNFFMQGGSRILQLSSGITIANNVTYNLSSNSGDGAGVNNVDGDNELQGQINFTTGNGALNISSAAGKLTISGKVTQTSDGRTLYLGGASTSANTISGVIGETSGTLPVIKQGSGTWVLTAANTYKGDTLVNGGTLVVSNNLALQNSAFDTTGAGTLTIHSSIATPAFGGLKGANNLVLPATVTALTLNPGAGATPSYSGNLSGGTSMTLTKTGAGTQTLSGANTYTGNTTISAGTLALSGGGLIASTTSITIATNATFDVSAVTGPGYANPGTRTLVFNIDKTSGTTKQGQLVIGAINLTYGGPLTVNKTGSDALANGDSFTLITKSSGTLSGNFSSVTLPSLSSGLAWDTNHLATAGYLDVYGFTYAGQSMATLKNRAASLKYTKLTAKLTARGPVTFNSVAATSAQGGTLSTDGNSIIYTPLNDFIGSDSFTAYLTDGHGVLQVTVNVTVNEANIGPSLDGGDDGNGYFKFTASGMTNLTYNVQCRTLDADVWTDWLSAVPGTTVSLGNGVINWTNTGFPISAHQGAQFRLQQP